MAMSRHEYVLWGAKAHAKRGNQLPQSRLTPDLVRAIRANEEHLTAKQLAAQIGVHYRTIEKVRHFETWGSIA